MPRTEESKDIIADDFSLAEIADHRDRTLQHIGATKALWPGFVRLPSGERNGNLGKLVARLEAPLHRLFEALTIKPDDDAQTKKTKAQLAAVFDTMLGAEDKGKDDSKFEVALLLRRLERVQAEQKIVEALDELRARFADDVLNTGEMVVSPGLQAIEVARTAAASNPAFRSLLAPALDALGDMTKKARKHQEAARKNAKGKVDGAPSGEEDK